MDRDARNWHARVARMRVPLGGSTMSLQRERTLILTVLLILTAASWAILIWQSRTANTMGMGLTMGMGAALFLAIWVVMMIAMMFPAAAPMILVFAWVQRDRTSFVHSYFIPFGMERPTGCATRCSLPRTGSGPVFSDLPLSTLKPCPRNWKLTGESGEVARGVDWLNIDISLRNPWKSHFQECKSVKCVRSRLSKFNAGPAFTPHANHAKRGDGEVR